MLDSEGRTYQQLSPPDGLTPAMWEKQLKEKYPAPVPGLSRGISPELKDQLELITAAAAFWEEQEKLIKLKIREAMKNAETVTIRGIPFLVRKIIPVKGHWVESGHRDMITPPPKDR
jgi:hypothetical protein